MPSPAVFLCTIPLLFCLNMFVASVQDTSTSKSRIEHVVLCYFPTTLQLHNSPGDCARKLFKCSKDVASLKVCIEKNWQVLDFSFFVSDVISGVGLGHFSPCYLALDVNCYEFSDSLKKFLLEK